MTCLGRCGISFGLIVLATLSPAILTPAVWGQADTPAPIAGQVLDVAGQPAAGVQVLVGVYTSTGLNSEPVRTQTDAEGRFSLMLDPAGDASSGYATLVAFLPGIGLAGTFFETATERSRELSLRLLPVTTQEIEVLNADGMPLNLDRAKLSWVQATSQEASVAILDDPAFTFAIRDGRGLVPMVFEGGSFGVSIQGPEAGLQMLQFAREGNDFRRTLAKAGRVIGRVSGPDGSPVAGIPVAIYSSSPLPALASIRGVAHVSSDAEGRFEVPALVAGQLDITPQIRPDSAYRPAASRLQKVLEAGQTLELDIQLIEAREASGQVVDAETGEPIAGAAVIVGGTRAVSDAKGVYTARVGNDQVFVQFKESPDSFLAPFDNYQSVQVPNDAARVELPTFRLARATAVNGRVLNESGDPVSGADVRASWRKTDGQYSTLGSSETKADLQGRFQITRVPQRHLLQLLAFSPQAASVEYVAFTTEDTPNEELLELRIDQAGAGTITGQVRDPEGSPIANATVTLKRMQTIPGGQVYGVRPVEFSAPLRTDADGRFQTPYALPAAEPYVISVHAPGMLDYESETRILKVADGELQAGTIELQRMRRTVGRVTDPTGQPLADARVWSHGMTSQQLSETKTDAEGRFELRELHPSALFVFAEARGHRLRGVPLADDDAPLPIVLPGATDASKPFRPMTWEPPSQRQRMQRLVGSLLPIYRQGASNYFVLDLLSRIAPLDPGFVAEQVESLSSDADRAKALLALGEVDEAVALSSGIEDPYGRVFSLLAAADAAPDKARQLEILAQAVVAAQSVAAPDRRVVLLAGIAERLFDRGDRSGARELVEQAWPVAKELQPSQWSGYARGSFAEVTALVDLARARELIEPLGDEEQGARTRHFGNVAHELAALDPAAAEEFLTAIDDSRNISPYTVRVCYRMARVDLPRARRLADRLLATQQQEAAVKAAHAYGVMAMAIGGQDPRAARELLANAFRLLDQNPVSARVDRGFGVALALVHFSTVVDPDATEDYFWRAVTKHPGPAVEAWDRDNALAKQQESDAQLALLLAHFGQFPNRCQRIVEPMFATWSSPEYAQSRRFYRSNAIFAAMGIVRPDAAIDWQTQFVPRLSAEDRRLIPQPYMPIATMLAGAPAARIDYILEEVFYLWTIDREDL